MGKEDRERVEVEVEDPLPDGIFSSAFQSLPSHRSLLFSAFPKRCRRTPEMPLLHAELERNRGLNGKDVIGATSVSICHMLCDGAAGRSGAGGGAPEHLSLRWARGLVAPSPADPLWKLFLYRWVELPQAATLKQARASCACV